MTNQLQLSYRVRSRKLSEEQVLARRTFGALITKARLEHHYSLADLADRLQVTRQGIWEWEHGCLPSDENLRALAKTLHLSFAELLALKEQR